MGAGRNGSHRHRKAAVAAAFQSRHAVGNQLLPLGDDAVIADHEIRPLRLGAGKHFFYEVCRKPIVTVAEGDPIARGSIQTCVSRCGHACVFLMERQHPPVLFGILVADSAAAVRRAVVHQNDLNIFIGLPQKGIHRAAQILLHLIHRHDDRDLLHICTTFLICAVIF